MSNKDTAAQATFPDCPHWGKGGTYIYDPASGQRIPQPQPLAAVQSDGQAADNVPAETAPETQEPSASNVKEKKRG